MVSTNVAVERAEGESAAERVYEQVKAMAISFELPPGGRVNELAIAKKMGVSRTPLREALNRLTGDGFLTLSPKQGFFRKPLSVREISDLYELREQIEPPSRRWTRSRPFWRNRARPPARAPATSWIWTNASTRWSPA
jgi:DNA-binding GntR family transcriptional regulator